MAVKEEKKDQEKVDQVITAVYKVNLHCPQCASEIKKPLIRTQGVHNVDINFEKSEIKVKGVIDVIKIHKLIEKLSKKKVELISPQPVVKIKEKESAVTEKKVKETKEPIIRTTTIKVHLHCDKCEHDLRKKLLKHKGIYSVKTDIKGQTITVQGTIESDKLLSYMRKKVHKHAEIITSKPEKKDEKKEKPKVEAKSTEKKEDKKEKPKVEAKSTEKKEEEKEKPKVEAKSTEKKEEEKEKPKVEAKSTEVTEFKEKEIVEVKNKDSNTPYFIHYVYAPQLFSDENPNACCIM